MPEGGGENGVGEGWEGTEAGGIVRCGHATAMFVMNAMLLPRAEMAPECAQLLRAAATMSASLRDDDGGVTELAPYSAGEAAG